MKRSKALSILIPTKNRAHYLPHAIQSALNIASDEIEVIVSENHGGDNALELARSFADSRLTVIQPAEPLPMHDHWEYLLSKSTGDWVTFLGDDDAILPTALYTMKRIEASHPFIEAIYSARAYFFWPNDIDSFGELKFPLLDQISIDDSKDTLNKILTGQLYYCYTPQIYSGGFQRRSLIRRIVNARGRYFYSAVPDAASALNALLFTTHFARIGLPLTIVGTSPNRKQTSDSRLAKDREADFFGALSNSSVEIHPIVNDVPFTGMAMSFLETYLSAAPLISLKEVDQDFIFPTVCRSIIDHLQSNRPELALSMAKHVGVSMPTEQEIQNYLLMYPCIIPDPAAGSVVFSSNSNSGCKTISDAVKAIVETFRDFQGNSANHVSMIF